VTHVSLRDRLASGYRCSVSDLSEINGRWSISSRGCFEFALGALGLLECREQKSREITRKTNG